MALARSFCKTQSAVLLILGYALLMPNAGAQEASSEEIASGLIPKIGIELRHDNNIFRSESDERSSLITVLSPGLLAAFAPSRHRFALEYKGEFAAYSKSNPDNYDDHELLAGAHLALGRRSLVEFIGSFQAAHENRGTGLSEGFVPGSGLLDEPDEYEKMQTLGRLTYGATGTRGRLVLEAGQNQLDYTNHRDRTRFFDRDSMFGGGAFYFRIMPNTSLLLDLRATNFEYSDGRVLQPTLDSNEYRYLIGATWDVTGKTTGTVKVGYVEKQYDDDTRDTFSEPSWEVDIRWSPRTYSHFDFSTSRYPSEVTSVTGDAIDNTTYSIAWTHEWTERVTTLLMSGYADQEFRGSTGGRGQEFSEHGVTLAYEMRHWLIWEFGVDVSSRDSNINRFDFDGTIVRLGATLTF